MSGKLYEDALELLHDIQSSHKGSIGSLNNVYLPQLDREAIDALAAALASQGDEIKVLREALEICRDAIEDECHGDECACVLCVAGEAARAALEPGCLDTEKASKFDPDGSEYEEESYQTGG
jgi:hypothetical protein